MLDDALRYLAHNDLWIAACGLEAGRDLVGLAHYDVFPQIPEAWRAVHRRCLAGATEKSDLDVFVRGDGKREQIRWVTTPWRRDDGAIGGITIFAENLTAEIEARTSLAERESLIRQLFERSPLGLNLCTLDGVWLESNPAFLELIGY